MFDVVSVGLLVADVITKPVDKLPGKGLLERVDSVELFSGGNAMTVAVNLKKIGMNSAVVGNIGKDAFGDFLRGCLRKYGVNTDGVSVDESAQTSTSIVLSSSDGERTFLHVVGANGTFGLKHINWDVIADTKIVFVTGSFLMDTFDGAQTVEFLKKCKEMGKVTALDVCWDAKGRWGDVLNDAMPYIDIFMPSIDEAEKIAGKTDPTEIADVFFERGVKSVVIKLGKHGCYIRESKNAKEYVLPTYSEVKRVDTTGAGDSFCSGFLAAYAKGKSFYECADFGNATGTHCVMAKGATTGMKSYEEIEAFMADYKSKYKM